jgi:DNA-binding response OmpR family regulator
VLVVEDAEGLRHLMRAVLEDEGYTIIAVAIQADAVSLLKEVSFDLVITDSFTNSPRTILIDAAEILAASGTTPVALFTGHRIELASTLAAGFADLITKPVDIDVLVGQVRALLSATI